MTLSLGRVRKAPPNATPPFDLNLQRSPGTSVAPTGRVIPKAVVEASQQAQLIIAQAQSKAQQILAEAKRACEQQEQNVRQQAHEEAAEKLAQAWLVLRSRQAKAAEEALDANVQLARLVAERVLQEQLRLHPDTIRVLAQNALKSLNRAKQIRIKASARSAQQLQAALDELRQQYDILEIVVEPNRADIDLRFECDLGILDAALGFQLDRLSDALRAALQNNP